LLPFPGSLVFWGSEVYRKLAKKLPTALQIPLLPNIARHRIPGGIRVPQSGFIHEPNAATPHAHAHASHIRNTFKRTHRWDKILRDADELALIDKEDKMLRVLFSFLPEDMNLYDKPMARNVQLWTRDGELLLDGPNAGAKELKSAMKGTAPGGLFGYRFVWPPMQVGLHEVYWHRPLVAYRNGHGKCSVLDKAPLGYLTAYKSSETKLDKLAAPVELWPRLHQRTIPLEAIALHCAGNGHLTLPIIRNVRKVFDTYHLLGGKPIARTLARRIVTLRQGESLELWLDTLPCEPLKKDLPALIEPEDQPLPRRQGRKVPDSFTYKQTATRAFEVTYWKTIASLAEGTFLNKNNADCVTDDHTMKNLPYHLRQLDDLGDYLLCEYQRIIQEAEMTGQVLVGELPFRWQTDFDFTWMGGWLKNQDGKPSRHDSGERSQPGGRHVGPLRHGIHEGQILQGRWRLPGANCGLRRG
jgi:hypothetical protein